MRMERNRLPKLVCEQTESGFDDRNEAQERRDVRLKIREVRKNGGVLRVESLRVQKIEL